MWLLSLPGLIEFALRLTACTLSRGGCHGRLVCEEVSSLMVG
jgi:hypothetical protein